MREEIEEANVRVRKNTAPKQQQNSFLVFCEAPKMVVVNNLIHPVNTDRLWTVSFMHG